MRKLIVKLRNKLILILAKDMEVAINLEIRGTLHINNSPDEFLLINNKIMSQKKTSVN